MKKVTATDGVNLAVYESGEPDAPTIVCVHGYPDNHTVWDSLAAKLSSRFRVVTYDLRGFGDSDVPSDTSAYRIKQLNEDLGAVIDAMSPDRPVHVLAHDWGSVQSWDALSPNRLGSKIASFTSISGPSLDHSALWLRHNLWCHPGAAIKQIVKSYYIGIFLMPGLPQWLAQRGIINYVAARAAKHDRPRSLPADWKITRSESDIVNGLNLYKANMVRRLRRPRPPYVELPVQILAPTSDKHISVSMQTQAPRAHTFDPQIHLVPGNHWVVAQRPELLSRYVTYFVDAIEKR